MALAITFQNKQNVCENVMATLIQCEEAGSLELQQQFLVKSIVPCMQIIGSMGEQRLTIQQ